MKTLTHLLVAILVLGIAACSDNPVAHDDENEDLSVAFQMSVEDVHTLETVTFTITVSDHHGDPVTDFQGVIIQYRSEGTQEWRDLELNLSGLNYVGDYMFMSSGHYELRVMGQHAGHDHMEMLYEMTEHFEIERAHEDIGGFRVEFENFPGHVHDGETATLQFWIMEDTEQRNPVSGLVAEVHCEDPSGSGESHDALETTAGLYSATHTFMGDGEAHIALHFPGNGGTELEVDFHIPIAHGH